MLLQAFKNQIGLSSAPQMNFDLARLVSVTFDLNCLVEPILREEIDRVIKLIPIDKAPGPDGLNGLFIKKCWHLIKDDFYNLCQDFFHCRVNLESINDSFITLVPKISNLETANDFRPISLLNSSIKLLTKILAERL